MWLDKQIKGLKSAFTLLTALPLTPNNTGLFNGITFFPLVGFFLGFINYALHVILFSGLSPELEATLIIGVQFVLTRGLHWDGLMDTFDGLFVFAKKERRLEILKNTSVGSFGMFGCIFCFLAFVFLLVSLEEPFKSIALFLFPVAGRLALVELAYIGQPAKKDGLGSLFLKGLSRLGLLNATLITALIFFFIAPSLSFIICGLFITFIGSFFWAKICNRYFGGITGDLLGAHLILSELLFLITTGVYTKLSGA